MLLASALYAYAVLFPAGDADRPSPYSGQFLHAADFYNLALTQVLSGAGAVPRVDDPRRQLTGSTLNARLKFYTIYDTANIRIDGHDVPLEYDQTALALNHTHCY
jgi:hypothetical protein